ncbi:MAG TPA: MGMT family protein [Anaerolineaceae bacterium]|nr:MGMT family protein [Anaerolineaceae bacterium]
MTEKPAKHGEDQDGLPLYQRVYALVKQIPAGKVATYGQIARMLGGCSARMVGYAMSALRDGVDPEVPWQRVINAQGRISLHGIGSAEQRFLLEDEGVVFDEGDRVSFDRYGWEG